MIILPKVSTFLFKYFPRALFLFTPILGSASIIDFAEVRIAAFFPTSERFCDNYGWVGANYQLEVGKNFGCYCCDQIWLSIDWYPKSGHLQSCGSSCLDILNVGLGYKRFWNLCNCFQLYAGIGSVLGSVWLENKRSCCSSCKPWKSHSQVFAAGAVARLGTTYTFCNCLFFDLFVDYLYEVAFFHRNAYIGGVKTGVGIGFIF